MNPNFPKNYYKISQLFNGVRTTRCLHIVNKLNICRLLGSSLESKRNVADIAKDCGANPDSLYRVMRQMSYNGVFEEVKGGEFGLFKHTPVSLELGEESMMREMTMQTGDSFQEALLALEATVYSGKSEAFGGKTFWQKLKEKKEYEFELTHGMSGLTARQNPTLVKLGEFGQFESVCDIGGCEGVLLDSILKEYPSVKAGINFDQPHVIKNILETLGPKSTDPRFQMVTGNFFEKVPEADCYILKWILHDWTDEQCVEIINSIARSAKPNSKVYIVEYLYNEPGSSVEHNEYIVNLDIILMQLCTGRERTRQDFERIVSKTPFKVETVKTSGLEYVQPITVLSFK